MSRPRTKFPSAITIAAPKDWPRTCRECQSFAEGWAHWAPEPERRRSGRVGRPRVLLNGQAAHQAALFATRFVWHLRELRGLGVDQHLREEKMEDWLGAVRGLEPYFRRDDLAWGEMGVISAGRWRDDVQYQAARRLLTHGLGLNQRSLRRRFDERAYWGRADELRVK